MYTIVVGPGCAFLFTNNQVKVYLNRLWIIRCLWPWHVVYCISTTGLVTPGAKSILSCWWLQDTKQVPMSLTKDHCWRYNSMVKCVPFTVSMKYRIESNMAHVEKNDCVLYWGKWTDKRWFWFSLIAETIIKIEFMCVAVDTKPCCKSNTNELELDHCGSGFLFRILAQFVASGVHVNKAQVPCYKLQCMCVTVVVHIFYMHLTYFGQTQASCIPHDYLRPNHWLCHTRAISTRMSKRSYNLGIRC